MTDFRALCAELSDALRNAIRVVYHEDGTQHISTAMPILRRARVALADEPAVPEGREPTVMEIIELSSEIETAGLGQVDFARAVLARWGNPAPQPSAEGEVAELVEWLQNESHHHDFIGETLLLRAAELLQRQTLVPVSVSDALIKAECALSDIAEGEPMTDEGDTLQWAERRCADTLATIRPTMRQHKIRTSEWPPLPLPEVSE